MDGTAVFSGSMFPLVVALVGTTVGPFVFQFWVYLVTTVVWVAYLMLVCPSLIWSKDTWLFIVRRLPTGDGVLSVLNTFGFALFVWATWFLDTAVGYGHNRWLAVPVRCVPETPRPAWPLQAGVRAGLAVDGGCHGRHRACDTVSVRRFDI